MNHLWCILLITFFQCMSSNNLYSQNCYKSDLDESTIERITGLSFPSSPQNDISYSDLSLLHIIYYDFLGNVQWGEMVCNKMIANDLLEIFDSLFEAKYPIEKIRLIDDYNADDEQSCRDNNSSSFCYRKISYSNKLSTHSLGMAVDINPLYNPYIKTITTNGKSSIFVSPANAGQYTDRSLPCKYYIKSGDIIVKLFKQHGFQWGGDWRSVKDFQHFEKAQ